MRSRMPWGLTVVAMGMLLSCHELPQEPSVTGVDSAQILRERATRHATSLTDVELLACGEDLCDFTPASYHCGGQKVECSLQTDPIEVTISTPGRPTILHVFGDPTAHGALLCNETMGTVRAYDSLDVELAVATFAPTNPDDCGADNITFAGETTVEYGGGIDHIIIEPMSPLKFPVSGSDSGIASAFYKVEYAITAPTFSVTCTASVERGQSATCTVSRQYPAESLVVTGWQFVGERPGEILRRAQDTASWTWTGAVLLPGTVTVYAGVNGTPDSVTSSRIAVTPRDWHALPAVPYVIAEVDTGLPTHPAKIDSQLGRSGLGVSLQQGNPALQGVVDDQGPNHGWSYFTEVPYRADMVTAINRAALSLNSDFYTFQENQLRKIPGGGDRWYCPKPRVIDVVPYIEDHEGINPSAAPHSHTGLFVGVVDSLARRWGEQVAGPELLFLSRFADTATAIRVAGRTVSRAMDADTALNNLKTQPDGDMTIFSPACQFKWMSGT